MKPAWLFTVTLLATLGLSPSIGLADKIVDSDFAKGDFATLGWKADGAWDVFTYTDVARNPGAVARFAANKPAGSLTKTFDEIRNPDRLTLSLDCGWGWGDVAQGSDSISFLLLDTKGNGYAFKFHRTKANWAVQWSTASNGAAPKDMNWAPTEIDVSHAAVHDGGGLSHVEITREANGTWTITSKDWNKGSGGTVHFTDSTTTSFQKLVLLGTQNFDEQLFNKIVVTTASSKPMPTVAQPTSAFLNSIGICSTFPDRGQPLPKTVEMVKYCGFRWVRGGIEGLTTDGPTTLQTYFDLHKQTGVKFSWGLVSGGSDIKKLIDTARPLAEADALLAFEGNNEPNNWGVTYQGEAGGGRAPSWVAVAKLQRDMYAAVKSDPLLKKYPVWSVSEQGGQTDNVGLQFLTIPPDADTRLPAGTKYADFANVHNYIYHPGSPGLSDNKTWNAADPTSACKVDGLFGNYGSTWAKHFRGYSENDLLTLPRVTTETGCTIDGAVTEEIQALNLLSLYLAQFKRGWTHTSVYLLRDRADEAGNQSFGYFKLDYTPRKAAVYLHNLTTILADQGSTAKPGEFSYLIARQPATVHDLLLQKSDGTFQLVIWNERLKGSDEVTVHFASKLAKVNIYNPILGTDVTAKHPDVDSLNLTLSNHPLILEITSR